jgi:hypothetical protein
MAGVDYTQYVLCVNRGIRSRMRSLPQLVVPWLRATQILSVVALTIVLSFIHALSSLCPL